VCFLEEKRTKVCCGGMRPGFIYCNKISSSICTWGHERNGLGNLKILGFGKPLFSSKRIFKIENCVLVKAR